MANTVSTRSIEEKVEERIWDWGVDLAPKVPSDTLTIVVGDVTYNGGVFVKQTLKSPLTFSMAEVSAALASAPISGLPSDLATLYGGLKTLLYRLVETKRSQLH